MRLSDEERKIGYLPDEESIVQIAPAKFWSMSGATLQPVCMGDYFTSCLTISHMCLPCLTSGGDSPCVPGVIEGSEDTTLV